MIKQRPIFEINFFKGEINDSVNNIAPTIRGSMPLQTTEKGIAAFTINNSNSYQYSLTLNGTYSIVAFIRVNNNPPVDATIFSTAALGASAYIERTSGQIYSGGTVYINNIQTQFKKFNKFESVVINSIVFNSNILNLLNKDDFIGCLYGYCSYFAIYSGTLTAQEIAQIQTQFNNISNLQVNKIYNTGNVKGISFEDNFKYDMVDETVRIPRDYIQGTGTFKMKQSTTSSGVLKAKDKYLECITAGTIYIPENKGISQTFDIYRAATGNTQLLYTTTSSSFTGDTIYDADIDNTTRQTWVTINKSVSNSSKSFIGINMSIGDRIANIKVKGDLNAINFINNAGITDTTQKLAIYNLVVDLKEKNLWGKMKALYPFTGGTATTHKFNLINPVDSDAAFRLTFNGGLIHSLNGILPNTITSGGNYADTNLSALTSLSNTSLHLSYYSRTNVQNQGTEFNNKDENIKLHAKYSNSNTYYNTWSNEINAGNITSNSLGLFVTSRLGTNETFLSKNGIILHNSSLSTNTGKTETILLFRLRTTEVHYSTRQCAFASIGDGLTDTDALNLYNIVQKYQTTLSRQV